MPRREIGVQLDEGREIDWVLQLPNKDVVNADPTLSAFLEEKAAEACYESLCLHYVALTRARYANYLITDGLPKSSKSKNFVALLRKTLKPAQPAGSGVIWETGEQDWYGDNNP